MTEPTGKAEPIAFERDGTEFTLWLAVRKPSQWSPDGVMSTDGKHFATPADLAAAGYYGPFEALDAVIALAKINDLTERLAETERRRFVTHDALAEVTAKLEAAERELAGVRRLCGRNLAASTPDELRALFRQLIAMLAKLRDQRQPVASGSEEPKRAPYQRGVNNRISSGDADSGNQSELGEPPVTSGVAQVAENTGHPSGSAAEPEAMAVVERSTWLIERQYGGEPEWAVVYHGTDGTKVTRWTTHAADATWYYKKYHALDVLPLIADDWPDRELTVTEYIFDDQGLSPAVTRAAEGLDPMLRCPTYGELIATLREVRTGFGGPAGELASELAKHLEHRATGGGK